MKEMWRRWGSFRKSEMSAIEKPVTLQSSSQHEKEGGDEKALELIREATTFYINPKEISKYIELGVITPQSTWRSIKAGILSEHQLRELGLENLLEPADQQ